MQSSKTHSTKWKKRYLKLANDVGKWSKDPSTKVGAVIIGDAGQIIAQGFNGLPRGIEDTEHRLNHRETKHKYVIHAEMNAVFNSIHSNSSVVGSTIYVSGLPVCHECAAALIQCGIKHVVSDTDPQSNQRWTESSELALSMFKEAGVTFETMVKE